MPDEHRLTIRLPQELYAQLASCGWPGQPVADVADTAPTAADTPAPPRRPGRPSGLLRQQILDLLQAHPAGLRAEELRVYLQARRPIGDTLQGMLKGGVITAQGQGIQRRYVRTE
jgi:hypothetical protein